MNKEAAKLKSYTRCYGEKGLFVLIHNFNYTGLNLLPLKGSQKDADAILDVFAKLDFEVILKENLTAQQIICLMKEIKKNELNNRSCLWVYVLAHGNKGQQILGVNSKYVSVRQYIMEPFLHNCSQLTNKPKLFFVDACQGASSEADTRHIDGTADTTFSEVRGDPDNTPTDTDACDWLLEYSCRDGHTSKVGVFTPKLAKILQGEIKAGSQQDLVSILGELCSQVTHSSTGIEKQVPVLESTLTKRFYPGQHAKSYGQTTFAGDSGFGKTYDPTAESIDQAPDQPEFESAMNNEAIDNCLQNNKFNDAKELIAVQIESTKCEREILIYELKQDLCYIKMGNKGKVQHHTEQWRKTICGDRYTRTKQVDDFFYVCKLFSNNGLTEKALIMLQHAADLYYELGDAQSGSPGLEQCVMLLCNLEMDQREKNIELKKICQYLNRLRHHHKISLQPPKQLQLSKKIPNVTKLKKLIITKKSKEVETQELETKNMQTTDETSQLVSKLQIALPTVLSMNNVKTLYLHNIQRKIPDPLNFENSIAHLPLNAEGNRSNILTLARKKGKKLLYECWSNSINTAQANEDIPKNVPALMNQENLPTNVNTQHGANQNQYLEGKIRQATNDTKETSIEETVD